VGKVATGLSDEMLATIPKHKGTEKLQADLKRRLAKLSAEMGRKHGVSKASAIYTVRREGAGQVVLVGAVLVGLLHVGDTAAQEASKYPTKGIDIIVSGSDHSDITDIGKSLQ
jgi:ribosome-interacting GTPase 1